MAYFFSTQTCPNHCYINLTNNTYSCSLGEYSALEESGYFCYQLIFKT